MQQESFTVDDARRYIRRVSWIFARTMRETPHEYTLRKLRPELDGEFAAFVALIRRTGVRRPWPRPPLKAKYRNVYLQIGIWEYWTMGAPIDARDCRFAETGTHVFREPDGCTILINRARAQQPEKLPLPLDDQTALALCRVDVRRRGGPRRTR